MSTPDTSGEPPEGTPTPATPGSGETGDEPEVMPPAEGGGTAPVPPNSAPLDSPAEPPAPRMGPTRLSGTWTGVAIALVLLILLLVFILLNLQRVEVNFFGARTHLPLAIVLLLAVVFGSVLVFAIGAARILQVRWRARRATGAERTPP